MSTDSSEPAEVGVSTISIKEEMETSYLDYAMSVIVSRALPDVRDGLKPVHRRIIYAMHESGYEAGKPYRKSARIVGDVMGKYHPHGDSAIYDTMVRMAQDFSMRLPLIDGQGNFGSMDGDRAAAMRYTEARMAKSAHILIADIGKDTVDFKPNYDETTREPVVLPAEYPNLLVNGAGGIAVGMATNIPPHNLGEVIDASLALADNPDLSIDDLIGHIKGPDFPTGGLILGRQGIYSAYHTGRGSVVMRGRATIEDMGKGRQAIIITEVPYQVNKARMIENMADLVRDKKIEGISDLRDESDRDGVRVVVEIKRDAVADVVLNQLYRFTALQSSFGVNMLALNGGRPELMNLKQILQAFLDFREQVIRRRTIFELGKAREKAHVLAGLAVAVANIDDVIALIRKAKDPSTARTQLMAKAWPAQTVEPLIKLLDEPDRKVKGGKYTLSEAQARAILELRLHRLTGLERDKIGNDLKGLGAEIEGHLSVLASREKLMEILKAGLLAAKEAFADPRRTEIEEGGSDYDIDVEDLIQREDMVVTVSNTGYIKRVPLSTYRAQRRGGRGRAGMKTREEDFVSQVFVVNTHTPVLFFSDMGMVYKLKVYKLPLGTPQTRGKALINLLPMKEGETITTLMPLPEDEDTWSDLFVMFATGAGNVRRNRLSDFVNVKANGKIAMKLDAGDHMIGVQVCTENNDVLLAANGGKCVRFPATDVRVFTGRTSKGVRGMKLKKGDRVISMSVLRHVAFGTDERDAYIRVANSRRRDDADEMTPKDVGLSAERFAEMSGTEEFLLTVTENGYGKRTSAYEYRIASRGGQGITNIETSKRNGRVVASFPVYDADQLVMVTDAGQLIRTTVSEIRIAGRATQGVTLFKTSEGESVVSVTRLGDEAEEAGEPGASVGETVDVPVAE